MFQRKYAPSWTRPESLRIEEKPAVCGWQMGDNTYKILKLWKDGFTVEAAKPRRVCAGLVDIYDGANHLYQCLIIADEDEGGEMRYEFKRSTAAHDKAPLGFLPRRMPDCPVGAD